MAPLQSATRLVLVDFVFLAVLWVLNTIFVIIAAIQASEGKFYRYR
jgi:uncharacterized Tic20 family protein